MYRPSGEKSPFDSIRGWLVTVCLVLLSSTDPEMAVPGSVRLSAQETLEQPRPSLGVSQTIEQIVLPGTELTHKPVDPATTPLVVRVVNTFPHGDAFRYDISYFGMTEGEFDLREYLVRKDGSSTEDLPPIPVRIRTILDEGHIEPNELEIGGLSRFGGYWRMVTVSGLLWLTVLTLLIFFGRRRRKKTAAVIQRPVTLAELLKPAVERAIQGTLPREKYAELERFLFSYWQKRLRLEHLEPAEALHRIRNDEHAGPLVRQVEIWLHGGPDQAPESDVATLLAPYQQIDSAETDWSESLPARETPDRVAEEGASGP